MSQAQSPTEAGSALRSEQVARNIVQSGSETLLEWSCHNTPGQPAPVSSCLHGEKAFPYAQPEVVVFHFMPAVSTSSCASL